MENLEHVIKTTPQHNIIANIENYDANTLFYSAIKSSRYDLLISNNIRIDFTNPNYVELIEYILIYEDIPYFIKRQGYQFNKEEIEKIWTYVISKLSDKDSKLANFSYAFFNNLDDLNEFVKKHRDVFEKIIEMFEYRHSLGKFTDADELDEIILTHKKFSLLGEATKLSIPNLKIYSTMAKQAREECHVGFSEDTYLNIILSNKEQFKYEEVINLMSIMNEYDFYTRGRAEKTNLLDEIITKNISYLIELCEKTNKVPKCLISCEIFKEECIKRNKINVAVLCTLPKDIISRPEVITKYCQELNIKESDFYERLKWIYKYYEINNGIFKTLMPKMLKDIPTSLNPDHYERMINDPEIQETLTSLTEDEQKIVVYITNRFNYRKFDITVMISSLINNISNYKELTSSIDINSLDDELVNNLIIVLQAPDNYYNITNVSELRNFESIKNRKFKETKGSIEKKKDSLVRYLFNIDLKEAIRIDTLWCRDYEKSLLPSIKNSDLPKSAYEMLHLLNQIVESKDEEVINNIIANVKDKKTYNNCLPLESYLRSLYSELYSKTLYKVDNNDEEVKDDKRTITYNGHNVNVCIPRSNFRFFVHCVGTCSEREEKSQTHSYQKAWEDFPQQRDHFVACSYIDENKIFSLRDNNEIIFGFNHLEGSAIQGMGDTDIDSIGSYANQYSGTKGLMNQGGRARFFVPDEMLERTDGYNEFVIERRNVLNDKSVKRSPDYIIMSVDAIENNDNFNDINDLLDNGLDMITEQEKQRIRITQDIKIIKKILSKCIKEIITKYNIENPEEEKIINEYAEKIQKAKYYAECLKAAQQFDIPLIIIDQLYYFKRMLSEKTCYDEDMKTIIIKEFMDAKTYDKKEIYRRVSNNVEFEKLFPKKASRQGSFTIIA